MTLETTLGSPDYLDYFVHKQGVVSPAIQFIDDHFRDIFPSLKKIIVNLYEGHVVTDEEVHMMGKVGWGVKVYGDRDDPDITNPGWSG
jgi:hypothetical protein